MSGSGGTVYDANPPRGPCDRLTFRTVLNSPVPKVVKKIASQMANGSRVLLDIAEDQRGQIQIAVALLNGETAGAITADALLRLLDCMDQGNSYVGEVKAVSGARVEIQVMRR